jgi:hypothetical protein
MIQQTIGQKREEKSGTNQEKARKHPELLGCLFHLAPTQ